MPQKKAEFYMNGKTSLTVSLLLILSLLLMTGCGSGRLQVSTEGLVSVRYASTTSVTQNTAEDPAAFAELLNGSKKDDSVDMESLLTSGMVVDLYSVILDYETGEQISYIVVATNDGNYIYEDGAVASYQVWKANDELVDILLASNSGEPAE